MTYIKQLDGLRAFAVISVMLFHLGIPFFSAGWLGVPLFFVLSGFLITGILINNKNKPHRFKNFYIRRSLRIFPLYYFYILVVFFVLHLSRSSRSKSLVVVSNIHAELFLFYK